MAIKYRQEFYSIMDSRFRVSIDDDQLGVASNLAFSTDNGLFNLTYQGETSNRFQSVIPSTCRIGMLINSTDLEDLIDDMVNSEDGRFKMFIERYNKGTLAWEKFWMGNITTDQVSYEDRSYPFIFNITAIDQLGTLSKIDYNNAGTAYSGDATLLEHVINILDKTDQAYFHDATDIFIQTICTWYDANHDYDPLALIDPIKNTRVNHIGFYREDDDENIIYFNCLDVLKEIAQVMGARIYQSGGAIRIEQVNAREGATYYEFEYNKTGVQQAAATNSTDSITTDGTIGNSHLTGGNFEFLPGLKNIRLDYNHESNRNLLLNNSWHISSNFSVDVGSIVSDQTTSTFKFSTKIYIQVYETADLTDEYRFDFKLRIKHGTQYLQRTISDLGNGYLSTSVAEWDTVEGDYMITTDWVNDSQIIELNISFETPVVPDAIGDLTFDFNDFQVYKRYEGVAVSPNMTLGYWELQNPFLEFYSEGKPDTKNTRSFQINNDSFTGNTETKELSGFIGDPITNVTRGKLEIYNGSSWEDASAWSINQTGTTYSIMELMILEQLAGQKRGTMRYNGKFEIKLFQFHKRLVYATYNFMMMSGTFNSHTDTWTGTFFNLTIDRTNLSFATEVDSGSNTGGLPPSSGTNGNTGSTTVTFTPPVPQFFTNVTGSTITGVTGTLPTNSLANQYMELFRTGIKLIHTTHFTIDEINNEIDLVLPGMGEDFELKIY